MGMRAQGHPHLLGLGRFFFCVCFCPAADNDGPGSPMPDDDTHGTRALHYKQLLVGRMAGVSDDDNNDGKGLDNDNDSKRWDHWVGGR